MIPKTRPILAALRRARALASLVSSLMLGCLIGWMPRIRQRVPGAKSLHQARRVAVLVHWDPRSRVHDYVVNYAKCLQEAGFAVIFATSCKKLVHSEIARITPHVALTLFRVNRGYDFGAYNDAIAEIPNFQNLDCLLLVNDSVYGPLHDLRPVLARCDDSADVWGLTDSWDRAWHLQSYFLLFRANALRSQVFAQFWRKMIFCNGKEYAINQHEVGLSQKLIRAGLRVETVFSYARTREAYLKKINQSARKNAFISKRVAHHTKDGTPLNATHFYWDVLIKQFKYPFIKRDLLIDNSQRIENLFTWRNLVSTVSQYDISMIDRHLRGLVRNRAP